MPLAGDGRSGLYSATVTGYGGYKTPPTASPTPPPGSPKRLTQRAESPVPVGPPAAPAPQLSHWRAALANRATAPATWVAIGDSITEGQGASLRANRWVDRTLGVLRSSLGVTGGVGYLPAWNGTYGPDSGWQSYASTSGAYSFDTWGLGWGERTSSMQPGTTVTYVVTGTAADIWYMGNGGTLSWAVDGGSATTIDTSGTYDSRRTRIALGASGPHTIVLTAAVGVCYLAGLMVFDGDTASGIQLYESGHSGWKSGDFADGGATPGGQLYELPAMLALADADLVTIEVGTNDRSNGVPAADLKTNVQTLISYIRIGVPTASIAVVIMYAEAGQAASWAPYADALRSIAVDDPTIAILDFSTTMGAAVPGGPFSSDGLHPSDTGHAYMAGQAAGFAAYVAPKTGSGSGTWGSVGSGTGKAARSGSGTGSSTYAGAGTGRRAPQGAGSGTATYVGTGAGTRTPKATGAGAWTVTGAATGSTVHKGIGTGAASYTGAATGKRTPRATGTGTNTWAGTAAGSSPRRGTGTGSWSIVGAGAGATVRRGTGSGVATWTGTGSGNAPLVGASDGTGAGSWSFTGAAAGIRQPKASAAGAWSCTGAAAGLAVGAPDTYFPHVYGAAVLVNNAGTAVLTGDGVNTAVLAAEVLATAVATSTAGTAVLTPVILGTAVLTGDGTSTATVSGTPGTAVIQLT